MIGRRRIPKACHTFIRIPARRRGWASQRQIPGLADGKPGLPETSRLLDAMRHGLPDSTGVALGFDRLVMLAAGAGTLAEVLAFPLDRA